jgi:hypothetical protein
VFSGQLEAWLRRDGEKTIGGLGREFGNRSFAAAILVLMFVAALPFPTGGVSHVFEAITAIPFSLRWVRRAERVSSPRGARLFEQGGCSGLLASSAAWSDAPVCGRGDSSADRRFRSSRYVDAPTRRRT